MFIIYLRHLQQDSCLFLSQPSQDSLDEISWTRVNPGRSGVPTEILETGGGSGDMVNPGGSGASTEILETDGGRYG